MRTDRVVREDWIGGAAAVAGALRCWAGGLPVLAVVSFWVPSNMYAGLTQYADTVTCRPRTSILNALSVWATTLFEPLYDGSKVQVWRPAVGIRGSNLGGPCARM